MLPLLLQRLAYRQRQILLFISRLEQRVTLHHRDRLCTLVVQQNYSLKRQSDQRAKSSKDNFVTIQLPTPTIAPSSSTHRDGVFFRDGDAWLSVLKYCSRCSQHNL